MEITSEKIGLLSRRVLESLPEERVVGFVLLASAYITAVNREKLERAGGEIKLAIGNMASASAEVRDFGQIADLDFVEAIEISRILFPKDSMTDDTDVSPLGNS